MTKEEDIIKRIVKCYLCFEKEATATMIVKHIEETGYRVKIIQPRRLNKLIKQWRNNNSWFNVRYYQNKQGVTVLFKIGD